MPARAMPGVSLCRNAFGLRGGGGTNKFSEFYLVNHPTVCVSYNVRTRRSPREPLPRGLFAMPNACLSGCEAATRLLGWLIAGLVVITGP
jgi:hypothetical protein